MLKKVLAEIYSRDLNRLLNEINLYNNEENLWLVKEGINNSAGNLVLQLAGNLNHYIGAVLGNSGYVRNRPSEFALKNISKQALFQKVSATVVIVNETIDKLIDADFENDFPETVFGKTDSTAFMLVHLCTHLTYHLGQINYHRRLVD
jgi:hypothetical protein